MSDMRLTAQQLAAHGRFGDTMLLHVSPAEVEGIASLIPGGLTINPKTGLPEAFFFLPFLASLFGAAAPAAAAATAGAGALAAGTAAAAPLAAGAGLAAAAAPVAATIAPAATGLTGMLGSIGSGIGTAANAVTSGIGSLFGAGGTAATTAAAPLAGETLAGSAGLNSLVGAGSLDAGIGAGSLGLDTTVTGSIGGAGAATPAATAAAPVVLPTTMTTLPSTAPAVTAPAATTVAPTTLAASPETAATMAPTSSATTAGGGADAWTGLRAATVAPTVNTAATTTPLVKEGGLASLKGAFSMEKLPLWLMGASMIQGLLPTGDGGDDDDSGGKKPEDIEYEGGEADFPTREQENDVRYGEHNYFPNYKFANGGIVSLAGGGEVDPQMQMPQDMSFPLNGVPNPGGTDEAPMLGDIPSSNFPTSQIGTEPEPPVGEGVEPSTANDRELVAQTVEAILGQMEDPGPVLLAFVQKFGEPALKDLAQRVRAMPKTQGGQQPGPMPGGDGMSDSIPAMIDGQQPAALSQGEYVVPADAVSGLGNGSTDAGAQQLDQLVGQVRQTRTGSPQQPPQMNAGGLISGYAGGGIVGLADGGRVYGGPPGGAERGLNPPARQMPPHIEKYMRMMNPQYYPSDDLEDYGPGLMPEMIDRWIPSVQGYVTTGDWFATQPEIRRGAARKDAAKKRRK